MLHRFHGGIRLTGRKSATRRAASVPLEHGPEKVVLPLHWCCAQRVRPLVTKGESVLAGQRLAEPEGEDGIPLHASVSGRVLELRGEYDPGGAAVVLESDGMELAVQPEGPLPRRDRPGELSPAEVLAALRAGAVVDGEGRPAYVRLREAAGRADVLIVNAVECESYMTAVHRLLLEQPGEVLGGIRLMMRVLGLRKAVLAVGGDKADAVAALQARLPLRGGDISLAVLRRRYPAEAEITLVEQVTGKRTPPRGTPLDVGALVLPAATAAAAYSAVYDAKPFIRQIVTVAGGAVERPGNYLLPLGTRMEELLRETGWVDNPYRIVQGGPMTGTAVADLETPVGRMAGAVLALTKKECARYKNEDGDCIRCSRCIEVCPMHLEPLYLRLHADAGHWDVLKDLHVEDCIQCGTCTWACPAHIHIAHSIRRGLLHLEEEREEAAEK